MTQLLRGMIAAQDALIGGLRGQYPASRRNIVVQGEGAWKAQLKDPAGKSVY